MNNLVKRFAPLVFMILFLGLVIANAIYKNDVLNYLSGIACGLYISTIAGKYYIRV